MLHTLNIPKIVRVYGTNFGSSHYALYHKILRDSAALLFPLQTSRGILKLWMKVNKSDDNMTNHSNVSTRNSTIEYIEYRY